MWLHRPLARSALRGQIAQSATRLRVHQELLAGYPHHIENLGTDELHFLVFFDRAMPQDIGYTGGIPAFPRRIVAPTLGMTVATLPRYPERTTDAMIVEKRNAVAP